MQDLLKTACKNNMAGHIKASFTDVKNVESIELNSENERVINLKQGLRFFEIESEIISVNAPVDDGAHQISIEIEFNGVQNQYDSVLNRMLNHKYICKVLDNNGTMWGAGLIKQPLNFSYERVGDADAAGRCIFMLRFFRQSTIGLYRVEL